MPIAWQSTVDAAVLRAERAEGDAREQKERAKIAEIERQQEAQKAQNAFKDALDQRERANRAEYQKDMEAQRAQSAVKEASLEKDRAIKAEQEKRLEAERAQNAAKEAVEQKEVALQKLKESKIESATQRQQILQAEQDLQKEADRAMAAAHEALKQKELAVEAEQEKKVEAKRAKEALDEALQHKEQAMKAEQEKRDYAEQARAALEDASTERDRALQAEQERYDQEKRADDAEAEALEERERSSRAEEEIKNLQSKMMIEKEEKQKVDQEVKKIKEEREKKEKEEKMQREDFRWDPNAMKDWSKEEANILRKAFIDETGTVKGHTMLLFGPTGNGKSSFANGCLAALEDTERIPKIHHVAASAAASVSKAFTLQHYGRHRIVDMPGIFEATSITDCNIKRIVTGQVPWFAQVESNLETSKQMRAKGTVECIIIILRYDCELPTELRRQIGVIWELCGKGELTCHLVLTHLDICDAQFKDTNKLPCISKSPKVLSAVEKMSNETGIPSNNISFVKNYKNEHKTDLNSKLQYLWILDLVKESADLQVKQRKTQSALVEEHRRENETFLEKIATSRELLLFGVVVCIAIIMVFFVY